VPLHATKTPKPAHERSAATRTTRCLRMGSWYWKLPRGSSLDSEGARARLR
jgi:hypothetical protein